MCWKVAWPAFKDGLAFSTGGGADMAFGVEEPVAVVSQLVTTRAAKPISEALAMDLNFIAAELFDRSFMV